ncbi:MAG TPA: acetylglutamate kinase [Pseudonocardiaceae bacterium]|nr:acetylglutamate kinase [Pseudonocardiaceae bacterium]
MNSDDVTVVKCGGTVGMDLDGVTVAVAERVSAGHAVILVHGGSGDAVRLADRLDVPLRQMVSPDGAVSRYTDPATLEVLRLAWSGVVKPALVAGLARHGVPAVGVTGLDGGLLRARRNAAQRAVVDGRLVVVRDDHSGRITAVRAEMLRMFLVAELVPVVSPPAVTSDGAVVNVDADRVAAAIAVAVGARHLVLLTAAPGVLSDRHDPRSLLDSYRPPPDGRRDPSVEGGMAVKLVAAQVALAGGVPEVSVADGRTEDTVRAALTGHDGTVILPPANGKVCQP